MVEYMGKWPSEHGQLTKIKLSDCYGGETIKTDAKFWYDRRGFEGYLGNIGSIRRTKRQEDLFTFRNGSKCRS